MPAGPQAAGSSTAHAQLRPASPDAGTQEDAAPPTMAGAAGQQTTASVVPEKTAQGAKQRGGGGGLQAVRPEATADSACFKGMCALGAGPRQLVVKLDGTTARVLSSTPLRQLQEFGTAGMKPAGAVALGALGAGPPRVIVNYKANSVLECWNVKSAKVLWRLDMDPSEAEENPHREEELAQLTEQLRKQQVAVHAAKKAGDKATASKLMAEGKEMMARRAALAPTNTKGPNADSEITQLIVTPGGSMAVAGTVKGTVAWIDTDGTVQGEIAQLQGPVSQLVVKPDGSGTIAGTKAGEVAWISANGAVQSTATKLGGAVRTLAIVDDSVVVAGMTSGRVAWIGADGVVRGKPVQLDGEVWHLVASADGSAVAAATSTGIVAWIDQSGSVRGRETVTLPGQIWQLLMLPDGSAVVAATDKGAVVRINADGTMHGQPADVQEPVEQLAATRDGSAIAFGTKQGAVGWIGADGSVRTQQGSTARLEGGKITQLLVSPDGSGVLACAYNGDVAFVSADGTLREQPAKLPGQISDMVVTPDGSAVITGTDQGELAWMGADGNVRGKTTRLNGWIMSLVASPDGSAVVGTDKGAVAWVDADGRVRGGDPAELDGWIWKLVLAKDGSAVVVGTKNGQVAWINSDGSVRSVPAKIGRWVKELVVTPDGKVAVAGTDNGGIVWINADGSVRGQPVKLHGEIKQLALTPDGSAVVAGSQDGEVAWVGSDGAARSGSKLNGRVEKLVMVLDGTAVVVATSRGEVTWIGADGKVKGEPTKLGEGVVAHMLLAPDGKSVVVGTRMGKVAWITPGAPPVLIKAEKGGHINTILPYRDDSFLVYDSRDGLLMCVDCTSMKVTRAAFDSRRTLQGSWEQKHKVAVLGGSLIFGSSFSSLFALDIDRLLKTSVECVTTFGPRRADLSSLEVQQENYGSRLNFWLACFGIYTTTIQFISVGFMPSIAWNVDDWVYDVMAFARNLGFDGLIDFPAGGAQAGAMVFVLLTLLILTVQESVEDHMFRQDPGNWATYWVFFDSFTSAVATVLFMPVVIILLDPLDCVDEASLSSDSGNVTGGISVMEANPDIVCWEGPGHLALVTFSSIFLVLYTTVVLRLIRVGGDLRSVEFRALQPWRYQDDTPSPSLAPRHPLAAKEDDAVALAATGILSSDVALKLVNSVASKLLSDRPVYVAGVVMLTGTYLTYDCVTSSPYDARSINRGVASLNFLIFLAGCTAQAIAMEIDALVLQQIFGVLSMLTSFGTLFALTPTGSQLFKDGKVQRIVPASEGGGSVTVNPVADEE